MLKLVISDDEGKTTVVPLVRDEITIGRKEGNTIRLTERNVSRRHARLRKADGAYLIEDLASYNGVKVNGQRIGDEVQLEAGDEVTIGDYVIAMQSDAASPGASTEPGGFAEPTPPARIVMLTPPAPGAEFAMRDGMRIGRAEDLDVWVNHRSISREHAEIRVDGEEVTIVDLGSANGMRVNGEDIKEAVLSSGDVIELGQVRFRFVAEGEHYVFESDRTVQMDAVTLSEPPPSKTSYIAAAAILLIAVIVGAGIALSSGDDTTSTPVENDPTVGTEPSNPPESEEGTPAAAAASMVAECEQAMQDREYDEAVRLANSALELDPGNEDAQTCKSDAQRVIAEQATFDRGLAAVDEGNVEEAYYIFEELPADSPFRDREEVTNVQEAYIQYLLDQAREHLTTDPEAAQREAESVLTIQGRSRAQERAAEQILARLDPGGTTARTTMRRRGGGGGARMTGGGGGDTQQNTATNNTQTEMTSAAGPINVRDVQRECRYDNRCIIDRLRGAPQNAQVLGVLVEANRSIGNGPATRRLMQEYLRRYPTGPQAGAYRRQLGQ
ncbi:MAG: FHA domain-containing protein [Deltaproteobacteria bacterium]|nr:FHA domain-containing protein [Deltaproteobacteria bacterium]